VAERDLLVLREPLCYSRGGTEEKGVMVLESQPIPFSIPTASTAEFFLPSHLGRLS